MSRSRMSIRLAISALCALAQDAHAAAADGGVTQPGNPLWTISLNALTATRERPLFSPSRRPASTPAPAAIANVPSPAPPPAEPEQLQLRLLGTIAGHDTGIAICLNLTTNEVLRVRTGDSHEGWLLRSVKGREATFEKASRQAVLALPSPDDAQPPAPPQIAGAPPMPMSPVNTMPAQAAPVSGTWRDGDGNLIAPPKR